jgi:hypothetical protein
MFASAINYGVSFNRAIVALAKGHPIATVASVVALGMLAKSYLQAAGACVLNQCFRT